MIEKPQALKLLDQWQDSFMSFTELQTGVEAVFGCGMEAEFYNTIWRGFDRHTLALAAALGDADGWLSWYAHENDFGAKGLSAKPPNGKFRQVTTLVKLYTLIVESRGVK